MINDRPARVAAVIVQLWDLTDTGALTWRPGGRWAPQLLESGSFNFAARHHVPGAPDLRASIELGSSRWSAGWTLTIKQSGRTIETVTASDRCLAWNSAGACMERLVALLRARHPGWAVAAGSAR